MNGPNDDAVAIEVVNGGAVTNGYAELGDPLDCYGYSWVDFFVTLSNIAGGATELRIQPQVRTEAAGTPAPMLTEELSAGVATQYLWTFTYPGPVNNTPILVRVPRIGRFVSLSVSLDVGTANADISAMRRVNGA